MSDSQGTNALPSFNVGDFNLAGAQQQGAAPTDSKSQPPPYDPTLFMHNPGSFEELHKKTKGIICTSYYLFFRFLFYFKSY